MEAADCTCMDVGHWGLKPAQQMYAVNQRMNAHEMCWLAGSVGMGHVQYPTTGMHLVVGF